QYDAASWNLLLAELPKLSVPDRVNLLADTWALVQAERAPLSQFLQLVDKLPTKTELAEREQIMTAFEVISRLLKDEPQRPQFQQYARAILRPSFDELGWEPRPNESTRAAALRVSLLTALSEFDDGDILAGARLRFEKFLADPVSLAPDLRAPVLRIVGRHAYEATWNKLHELGQKTNSIEEKQNYYEALSAALDPKLIERSLRISLTDELPTSRAVYLVPMVAGATERPDLAWTFAKANMKTLRTKSDALGALKYAPSLFTFFSDPARIAELQAYAKADLPPAAAKAVAKATDEITFRAEFKKRLIEQAESWGPALPSRE
ncbi:MAG: ERAP1-like C-terminal domain-containing protein, partial [Chthoniobacterales bacterium]